MHRIDECQQISFLREMSRAEFSRKIDDYFVVSGNQQIPERKGEKRVLDHLLWTLPGSHEWNPCATLDLEGEMKEDGEKLLDEPCNAISDWAIIYCMIDCVEAIVGAAHPHLLAFADLRGKIAAVETWLPTNDCERRHGVTGSPQRNFDWTCQRCRRTAQHVKSVAKYPCQSSKRSVKSKPLD